MTMRLNFVEDIDIDISNWQQSISMASYGINWKDFLPDDITADNVKDTDHIKKYLEEKYYKSGKIANYKKWLKSAVDSSQIQSDLEYLIGREIIIKKINVYITTFNRAPYSVEGSLFYLMHRSINRERSITNIYHECMHFIFHIFYWKKCKKAGLSEWQIHNLKECVTVLLNSILEKRGLPLDYGYPKHQELRKKLADIWMAKKWEFEDFLHEVLKSKLIF